jgi:SH3-like domain-containing protein
MQLAKRLAIAAALATLCAPAAALDYRAAARPAILYDAPSATGKKLYIASTDTPLEVVVTLEKWVKVRDRDGKLAWIARSDLADYQTVMVAVDSATVREQPDETAGTRFMASRGVVLRLSGPAKGSWLPVRHADGDTGYIRRIDVWGD